MKKIHQFRSILILTLAVLLFAPSLKAQAIAEAPLPVVASEENALPYADSEEEHIESFDSRIAVNADNSIDVTETIVYDFGDEEKHGIYREIPLSQVSGAVGKAKIHGLTVTDENGTPYTINDITYSSTGVYAKVGDADRTITGLHTYVVRYHVTRAVGYFEDFDEIYWNVTGSDWEVPIYEATATVILPAKVEKEQVRSHSYCGAEGSGDECGSIDVDESGKVTIVHFSSDTFAGPESMFSPYEGMTVSVGFPKGLVAVATVSIWEKNEIYYAIAIGLAGIFLLLFLVWYFNTYLPKYRSLKRPIIAEYEPPAGVTPSMAGQIYNKVGIPSGKMATVDILHLAAEGYITIESSEDESMLKFLRRTHFSLTRTAKGIPDTEHLARLYQLVTAEGVSVDLDSLKTSAKYSDFDAYSIEVISASEKAVRGDAPIPDKKEEIIAFFKKFALVALAVVGMFGALFIGSMLASKSGINIPPAVMLVTASFFLSLIVFGVIRVALKAKLKRMTPMWYAIAGLREYIKVAEQERIKFESNPADSMRIFSKLLPYATVFGLENKWAGVFAGIVTTPPDWYHSTNNTAFSAGVFVSSMHSLGGSISAASDAGRPVSSSSGSSGSSGGGSSGGGGGGGGGGSW